MGKVVEEEAVYGVGHVGFGTDIAFRGSVRAGWHVDGYLAAATVSVAGRPICENGRILLPPRPVTDQASRGAAGLLGLRLTHQWSINHG